MVNVSRFGRRFISKYYTATRLEHLRKTSKAFRADGSPAEIRTQHLNSNLKRLSYTNIVGGRFIAYPLIIT
jgi:hypothetical protein